jgi:lysine 6-dehydrogenase
MFYVMKTKVIVLGAGLIGKPLAVDLAKDPAFEVTVADKNWKQLESMSDIPVHKKHLDLTETYELKKLLNDFDLAVNAVPGFMGFKTLKIVIETGTDCVDLAFYPENVLDLSEMAREKQVRVIADMGVAPGMSNLLAGYAAAQLDKVEKIDIFVGGLPVMRQLPWEYKAVFSPTDVIEEYTRPARLVENGKMVTKPPLSEIELIDFEKTGTLEAFNSDGLRSLMFTLKANNMREKTLRYPGYAEKIKFLAANGFFDTNKIDVNGSAVSPLEFTSRLLFKQWKLEEGEEDLTVMKIVVEGEKAEKNLRYTFDLYDRYDKTTHTHSMARTTAYAASQAVRLMVSGLHTQKGIVVPEYLGKNAEKVDFMLSGLAKKNVVYQTRVEEK